MKRLFVLLDLLVLFVTSLFVGKVSAEELHLALYPPIIEIVTTENTPLTAPITLTNLSNHIQTVTISFKPFLPEGEDGTIAFTDSNKLSVLRIMQDGKELEETLDLRPNEKRELILHVDIPQNASDSGILGEDIYATVLVQTKNTTNPSQTVSKVVAGIGTNILISVRNLESEPNISAGLKEFSFPTVLFDQPVKPTVRIENKGEHFLKAEGVITLFDQEGKEIKKIRLPVQNVLAHATRNISIELEPISPAGLFGKYRAEVKVDIGEGKTLSDSLNFYAVPKKVGIISVVILLVFALFAARFRLYTKRLADQKSRDKKKGKTPNAGVKKAI